MMKIKWIHVAIGLALVVGLLIGSHVQFAPSIAFAQTSSDSSASVAMTVTTDKIFIVRGNHLYLYKMIDDPLAKNHKFFILLGNTTIEQGSSTNATNISIPAATPSRVPVPRPPGR